MNPFAVLGNDDTGVVQIFINKYLNCLESASIFPPLIKRFVLGFLKTNMVYTFYDEALGYKYGLSHKWIEQIRKEWPTDTTANEVNFVFTEKLVRKSQFL